MLKRTISFILAIVALASSMSFSVSAQSAELAYGVFEYSVLMDGTVRIDRVVPSSEAAIGLYIPETIDGMSVSAIGDRAYLCVAALPGVTEIPRSIVSIGEDAFSGQFFSSLSYGGTEEEWANLLTHTAQGNDSLFTAFVEYRDADTPFCYRVLADGSAEITWYIGATDVTALSIPSQVGGRTVRSISGNAHRQPLFSDCLLLETIIWPQELVSIGNVSFAGSALKELALPSELMIYASDGARQGCFEACVQLTEVVLSEPLLMIPSRSFADCSSLSSVTLFASCDEVGENAFDACTALTDVYVIGTKAQWDALTIRQGNEALLAATVHCSGEADAMGDMNVDEQLDMRDAFALYNAASGDQGLTVYQQAVADMNGDGEYDMRDAFVLYQMVSGG